MLLVIGDLKRDLGTLRNHWVSLLCCRTLIAMFMRALMPLFQPTPVVAASLCLFRNVAAILSFGLCVRSLR